MSKLTWTKIQTQDLPRSSHSISLVGNKAYIFGGEINPREPVDDAVHVVDIQSGTYERIEGTGDVPTPRVGHVAGTIGGTIYIFGGRGGPDMTPLDECGAVYAFSTSNHSWTKLSTVTQEYPCARSYHTATASPTHLIIHAGCGDATRGRLKDTWLFDVKSRAWTQVADGPGDPRGGSAITFSHDKVWRFGGFNGKTELGGTIDYLPLESGLSGTWETVVHGETNGLTRGEGGELLHTELGPGHRSVHALIPLQGKMFTLFGEGKPSPTGGHDAAGNFWGDVWAFDPANGGWKEVKVVSDGPGERGWFAAAHAGNKVVIWGGIDACNERLADGWILSAE